MQEDTFGDIVVFIHNPGITELANRFSRHPIDNVPTCGMVIIEFDTDKWSEISSSDYRFVNFDYPKNSG